MVQAIKGCRELIPHLKTKIEDEGIEVGIDENLMPEELAIIRVS